MYYFVNYILESAIWYTISKISAKSLSQGRLNLSGNISDDTLDPLEELMTTVMKANQLKALTKNSNETYIMYVWIWDVTMFSYH